MRNAKISSAFAVLLLSVMGVHAADIDLSTFTTDGESLIAQDGDVLKGTLGANVKVSIADGAKVTLENVKINGDYGVDNPSYEWAGITCEGDCEIVLADNSENSVIGFHRHYPGIYVPIGHDLTISGSGKLISRSGGFPDPEDENFLKKDVGAAGIGAANLGLVDCGNIVIKGGDITAIGGMTAAGIGGSSFGSAGNIRIEGGTVFAEGVDAPGIGLGSGSTISMVGNIEIRASVNQVVSTTRYGNTCLGLPYFFSGQYSRCGTIKLGHREADPEDFGLLETVTFYGKNTIVYDANGGIGEMESQSYLSSSVDKINRGVTLRENTFTHGNKNLRFGGWNTKPDGSGKFYQDKAVFAEGSEGTQFKGSVVTLYAQWDKLVDLSQKTGNYEAQNGDVLFGTLGANVKVSIADGAKVTLEGVKINGVNDDVYPWAGLTCEGDCEIVLAKGSKNSVKGFHQNYPGIFVPKKYTLTISGSGELNASSSGVGHAAGIGGGHQIDCGNIVILGGSITATPGSEGSSYYSGAAGIGGGILASIGSIEISESAKITAYKRGGFRYSVGYGSGGSKTGTIKIGGVETEGIEASPFNFPETYYVYLKNTYGYYTGVGASQMFYRDIEQPINFAGTQLFRLDGYRFAGWNTDADGHGTAYADRGKVLNLAEKGGTASLYAQWQAEGDLSKVLFDYTAQDGDVLRGTLGANVKVSIANNAKVTLDGAVINGVDDPDYPWAGISCNGNCEIVLAEGSKNVVKGFDKAYPGIHVPNERTLTISGSGELDASSNGYGAGIGGGYRKTAGNIAILGGTIKATAGPLSLNILGGMAGAAGIGGGPEANIGSIEISESAKVTATKGKDAPYSVGSGSKGSVDGSITIGGVETEGVTASTFIFPETYTVAFDGNGGNGNMLNKVFYRDVEQAIDESLYQMDGYNFIGWNTAADGSGTAYENQAKVVNLAEVGGTVTLFAQWKAKGYLADLKENYRAQDGDVITGKLGANVQISIAGGAKVILDGAIIESVNDQRYDWPGITCEGDCEIILADKSKNIVKGYGFPGIFVGDGYTLTIAGSGKLVATNVGDGAAGIGAKLSNGCGNIVIEGGSIEATGGAFAAGIGGSANASVGNITIAGSVTKVVATKGDGAPYSIGAGYGEQGSGVITIGGMVSGDISVSPFEYPSESYTVAFDGNGGSGSMESRNVSSNLEMELSANAFVREGYSFICWNTAADGSGTSYADKAKIKNLAEAGSSVTLYALWWHKGDISDLKVDYQAQDGDVLTGELSAPVKISIANDAKVTLNGVTIEGVNDPAYMWAGITCEGNCEIVLAEGSKNFVKGFDENYPGIFVPEGYTLTISGSGKLDANRNGYGAGIGAGTMFNCNMAGDIVLIGGDITATGGGTSAGIGGPTNTSVGNITITNGVTKVTAVKGDYAPYSVGIDGNKGTITIGDEETEGITASPFTFPTAPYTVVFNANGGSGEMDNQILYVGSDKELNANAFTREGYTFAGWNTKADGSGKTYADQAKVSQLADAGAEVTLYAQWYEGNATIVALSNRYTAQNGDVLVGELDGAISIADGATVTLYGVVINGANNAAGITCEGDCNIVLAKKNVVNGLSGFPGIYVQEAYTLTIKGDGELVARGLGSGGAGIGGGSDLSCGNIVIEGGIVEAIGNEYAAGIGGGSYSSIGDIKITENVTKVTATKGLYALYSVGCGEYCGASGSVTVAGKKMGNITISPFTYPAETYTVVFDANGGSGERKTQTLERGWGQELEANTFTRDGYSFIGWNTKANGSGKTYADQLKVEDLAEANGQIILYAQWYKGSAINLASLTESYTAKDGDVLTGSLAVPVKISIADKATVTLLGVAIYGINEESYGWAGITCEGDCGIVLADGSENIVTAFYMSYSGIYVPENHTLTISGSGSLDVSAAAGQGIGAGIGGGIDYKTYAPYNAGNIVITGGTIRATGGWGAAGIGASVGSSVGSITITDGVTKVTATRGEYAYSIGKGTDGGEGLESTRTGDITIGGKKYNDIVAETFVYPTIDKYAAVQIAKYNGGNRVVINGDYVEADEVSIPNKIEVKAIDFQREFTPLTPSTVMLPVALPAGTTVNAEFYALSDVVQEGYSWKATMTNIKKITGNNKALPQPNTPYVVKLHEGESKLKFDMNGATAVVQTDDIQTQWNAAGTWFFTGTYAFKDWGKQENSDDLGLVYAFSGSNDGGVAKGTFGRVSTKSKANPMRSYLSKRDKYVTLQGAQGVRGANGKTFASTYSINLMPETIVVEFVDSDENGKERTTAIGRMNPATGEIRLIRMDRTYDLKGRSVNRAKKNARGAYYGKKVR